MLKIGHSVKRPGRQPGDQPVTIDVPQELETVPGTLQNPAEVDFYSREYPLESMVVTHTAVQEWSSSVLSQDDIEFRKVHERMATPIVHAGWDSADIEPTGMPVPGKDLTGEISAKARELGFGEVGFTRFDMRYVYQSKRDWVKFPHAICLAYEQDFEATQTIVSREAEEEHYGIYRIMGALALDLADYIRGLGYHAQVHNALANTAVYLPMFVAAGLGQMGANGQLLSPHFGSRARLMMITTDAQVTYDEPVDYGVNALCTVCQVCVNRCPGRALLRENVWWRGTQKFKVLFKRCRPVLAKYEGCGVCMKVCPVQMYGMKPVMDHYAATGQVLGKGTHQLEGYSMRDMGYFGPGELPSFDSDFFHIPMGKSEDVVFEALKEKIRAGQVPDGPEGEKMLREFRDRVQRYLNVNPDSNVSGLPQIEEA